jgi:hypothetical protein
MALGIVIFFGVHFAVSMLLLVCAGFKKEKKIEEIDYGARWRK